MRLSNPACYECKSNPSTIHVWIKLSEGRAQCLKCKLILNKQDTAEVFECK